MSKTNIRLDESITGHPQKKWPCPACNALRFVKFYDFDTATYLPTEYGKCDRSENCGYFKAPTPEAIQEHKNQTKGAATATGGVKRYISDMGSQPVESNTVDRQIVSRSLQSFDTNIFYTWLVGICGEEKTNEAFKKYVVGTAKGGGTIFWQIDKKYKIRTGQKIHYKPDGHRDKDMQYNPRRLYKVADGYRPCLFGEHLLNGNDFPVCLVEAEKTAIIASMYLPTMADQPVIWIATTGAEGLTEEKAQALAGRDIIMCPDFSYHARATWGKLPMHKKSNDKGQRIPDPTGELMADYVSKAQMLRRLGAKVRFYDPRPELNNGDDLADELIKNPLVKPKTWNEIRARLDEYFYFLFPHKVTQPQHAAAGQRFASLLKPHIKVKAPNFEQFKINISKASTPAAATQAATAPELQPDDLIRLLANEKHFRIVAVDPHVKVNIEPPILQQITEQFLNKNPLLPDLIKKLDICVGSISFVNG